MVWATVEDLQRQWNLLNNNNNADNTEAPAESQNDSNLSTTRAEVTPTLNVYTCTDE
jgi:hypothetical protein